MRIATCCLLLLTSAPLLAAEPVPIVEEQGMEPAVESSQVEPSRAESSGKDAPSRVARLSLTQGEVSLAPAGSDEWADAVLNRPLTSGDRVWVDRDARAEFQVGSAIVHLDQNSGFSFEQLDDDAMRMSLTDGAATVRVRRKLDGETIVVETPNASVALLHPGEYHIEVNEAGDATVVKVRSGEAAVTGEKDAFVVRATESGTFKGAKELTADISALGQRTAFESWANDRERREESSASSRYVSRDVVGYEDLDDDGDWVSEPEYGYVWTPRHVYAGWAPYRDGRWAWVAPWGWTWVDNARWGFAPFHYGRWAYSRSRWCWVPGPRHVRAIYAPALVGWVGSPGVNVSVGFGSGVGWYPLGPREVYVPGYWHSRRYIHNVNFANTVIVNNRYINDAYRGRRDHLDYRYRSRPNAVTVVPRNSFAGGRQVSAQLTKVPQRDLRRWHQDSRPPAIAPDRGSMFAGNHSIPSNDRNARFARAQREESRNRGSAPAGRVTQWRDGGSYRNRSNNDSARDNAAAFAPSSPRESSQRNTWRTSPIERSPRVESSPRPSFDSLQRGSRDNGFSPRYERQREARQSEPRRSEPRRSEPRVQAAPAQETSRPAPQQQQAAPRQWRGDGNRGGDGGNRGSSAHNSNRNANRQSQK
ncbi:MAG: DUF6600 domain-containing protein [Steroidobacteraceae bacterium]